MPECGFIISVGPEVTIGSSGLIDVFNARGLKTYFEG